MKLLYVIKSYIRSWWFSFSRESTQLRFSCGSFIVAGLRSTISFMQPLQCSSLMSGVYATQRPSLWPGSWSISALSSPSLAHLHLCEIHGCVTWKWPGVHKQVHGFSFQDLPSLQSLSALYKLPRAPLILCPGVPGTLFTSFCYPFPVVTTFGANNDSSKKE